MSDPQVTITGPFDQSGTSQGPATSLYLTEEAAPETETDTRKQDIPGQDDDETLLAPLDGQTAFSYNGVFNGNRIYRANPTIATPTFAVRKWLFELETLCSSKQGAGFKLEDKVSGFSGSSELDPSSGRGVLIEEAEWTVSGGDGLYGEWRVDAQAADGVQPQEVNQRSDEIDNLRVEQSGNNFDRERLFVGESSSSEYPLGSVEEIKYTRSIDLNVQQMIHNSDVPQVGLPESGVKGTLRLQGIITSRDFPAPNVSSLADWVYESNVNFHGEFVKVQESVTNREFGGAVNSTTATLSAGSPNKAEYTIEIDIGAPDSFDALP